MEFEWDETKAQTNFVKHGVTFYEAQEIFDDPLSGLLSDPDHSNEEKRSVIIGMTDKNRLLFVSFAERDETIRIISAREATRKENAMRINPESDLDDELRPEYNEEDMKNMTRGKYVGRVKRKCPPTVQLEADVVGAFPDAAAVNEALRFLIRVTNQNLKTPPGESV